MAHVTVQVKKETKLLDRPLPQPLMECIRYCATKMPADFKVLVTVQVSWNEHELRGLMTYGDRGNNIYIYPLHCTTLLMACETIAHEFGHFAHIFADPESRYHRKVKSKYQFRRERGWTKNQREHYAEQYSKDRVREMRDLGILPATHAQNDDYRRLRELFYR